MRKFKARIALKLVRFGIWLYEVNADMQWDAEDRSNVERLWAMHDEFSAIVKGDRK